MGGPSLSPPAPPRRAAFDPERSQPHQSRTAAEDEHGQAQPQVDADPSALAISSSVSNNPAMIRIRP
jgi:hypothetical protein